MTVIVGLKDRGNVYVGADSMSSNESFKGSATNKKIFRKDGMLMGLTGFVRASQLLRYRLTIPQRPDGLDVMEYMATLFIDEVRKTFKEYGYGKVENNEEHGKPDIFLVAYEKRLFEVNTWVYEVFEWETDWAACGMGREYALGSIATSKGRPSERVRKAVEVASLFVPSVGGDIQVMRL